MPRRLHLLVALLSALMIIGCQGSPIAPALTDPKEILTRSILSLKDARTVELTGSFTGAVTAAQLGNLDLSAVKLSGALDVPNNKAKLLLDAPSLLGTRIDAIVVDKALYLKVAGLLAGFAHASADKYTKSALPQSSTDPLSNMADIAQAVTRLKQALDALPNAPTRGADEKCGDQDCYRVTLKLTAADIKALNLSALTAAPNGDLTVDLWSRKNDLRPAKLALSDATPDHGTFGITLEFKYDGSVTIEAPPADQIAP
jgi:hypothetical protein